MTQEEYLRLKKEYKIRLVLVIVLFVLFSILSIVLIVNLNRFIPLGATAMATVVPFNHFLLVPLWEAKKAIEAEHPEWKGLSTSGAKVASSETSKRNLAAVGSVIALFFSFALLYRPAKVYQKVPTANEIKNLPKIENKNIPKIEKKSEEAGSSYTTSSESDSSSSTEEVPKTEASNTETHKYNFHVYGIDDEELDRVIDKSLKDIRENHAKKQATEDVEEKNE